MKAIRGVHQSTTLILVVIIPLLLQGAPVGHTDSCQQENKIKLLGSNIWGEGVGRVYICRQGEWKRVCDSGTGFTTKDAIVTCRQLGYRYPEVAHSLGSEELNYGTEATETVPDCRGNETSLSLCPAQPSPPNCAAHCARVDCNVDIIPTPSWQIASTSITETLSTSPHIRVTSIEATSTMQATFVSATVAVSVTTQPHVAPIETSTSTDKEEISEFRVLNLNKTSVMVIVGIVTVIVAAGVVASSYIIIRGARKRRRQETKKIVMTPNDAYLNREEALQLKNGVAACGLRADPVYEQIE